MKRIIDGKTYNTATAHAVAQTEVVDVDNISNRTDCILYVTRGGAFFLHVHDQERHYDDESREWVTQNSDDFYPKTRAEAEKWVYENDSDVELLSGSTFPDPPEASEQDEREGVSMLVRMPVALKRTIEAQAKAANQSANAWATRCFESCIQKA